MMRALFALVLGLTCLAAAPAEAERRVALVVGLAEYRNLTPLVRPPGDARAVRDQLARLGFEADLVLEADRRTLDEAVDRFTASVRRGDVVLVYLAGHAARIGEEFTLLPVDAPPAGAAAEGLRRAGGIGLYGLADDLKAAGAGAQVIIVDACRGDPYAGPGPDLASPPCGEVGRQMPEGSFVLFSASASQKALDRLGPDDRDPHTLFTRTLLQHLGEVRSVVRLARLVRDEVVEAARSVNYEQRPAYLDELVGPPVLLAPRDREVAGAPASPEPAEVEPRRPRPGPDFEPDRAPPSPRPDLPVPPAPRYRADAFRCGAIAPGPPAFNCRAARRLTELAICRDPRLGSCDRALNDLFDRVQARVGPGAPSLRREQEAWLARRESCAELSTRDPEQLADCIGRAYDERLAELEHVSAAPAPPPPPVARPSFDCRGARTPVEGAICADPVLAAKDRQMARLFEQAAAFGFRDVEATQPAWRASRDACARVAPGSALPACVDEAYDRRIRELRRTLAQR